MGSGRQVLSAEEREELIVKHLPQVRLIARRLISRVGGSVQIEDLISAGVLGLIAAVDKFDTNHHAQLKTYADYRIRGAMLDTLRRADSSTRMARRKAKSIEVAIRKVQQRLGRTAEEEDLAQELGLTVDQYRELLMEVQNVSLECYDAPKFEDDDSDSPSERLPGPIEQSPEFLCERQEAKRLLSEAISQLPAPEQHVLSLYFQHEVCSSEIAQIMNLRPARVSQLKAQGLLRLRNALQGRVVVRS